MIGLMSASKFRCAACPLNASLKYQETALVSYCTTRDCARMTAEFLREGIQRQLPPLIDAQFGLA